MKLLASWLRALSQVAVYLVVVVGVVELCRLVFGSPWLDGALALGAGMVEATGVMMVLVILTALALSRLPAPQVIPARQAEPYPTEDGESHE